MSIILKYLLRNIIKNKFRTFLIIFSILLSTALLFSTLSISKTTRQLFLNQMLKNVGTTEVVVYANENFSSPFFSPKDVSHLDEMIDYSAPANNAVATFKDSNEKNIRISLLGLLLNDLGKIHNPTYVSKLDSDFVGEKLIIGEGEALTYGFEVGDVVSLFIKNQEVDFTIYAITKDEGFFEHNGNVFNAVTPVNTIASMYGNDGLVSLIYFKSSENVEVNTLIKELFTVYKDFTVRDTIPLDQLQRNLSQITAPFSLMLVLVIFISIFIINTSFKVITIERLPVVGTFRSIGATKKKTNIILLGESLIFGIIGGVFGIFLGFGILNIMKNSISNIVRVNGSSVTGKMVFSASDIIISVVIAVIISIIGSLIPIMKTNKVPVKDILLNNVKKTNIKSKVKPIIGFILIFLSLAIISFYPGYPHMLVGALLLIIQVIGIILVIPFVTKGFVYVFAKVNKRLFGNIGMLSAKNIRSSKNIINNITLIVIGLASLLMILTVSSSVMDEVGNVFSQAEFEIVFNHTEANDEVLNRVQNLEGVEEALPSYLTMDVRYLEGNYTIRTLYGIDSNSFFDLWTYDLVGNKEQLTQELGSSRTIIPSVSLRDRLGIKVGDYMTLSLRGNEVKYKVIGFVNTLNNNGQISFVSANFLKEDMNLAYYSEILIKTNINYKDVVDNLLEEFDREIFNISTMEYMKNQNEQDNKQMFSLFTGFSIITMIIGSFGVFNNFLVSFLNRKRSIAILRSNGMSKKQALKMLLIESFDTGLIGGLMAIIGSFSMIYLAEFILKAMDLPLDMNIDWGLLGFALICSVLVSVLSALSPIVKSSKINLVQEIKYE